VDEPTQTPTPEPPTATPTDSPTATPTEAPTGTPVAELPTVTPTKVPCGYWTKDDNQFPLLDYAASCAEDVGRPAPAWQPITIGAGFCPAWSVYHTFQTGNWEIFRLGELPGNPGADVNLTKGVGQDIHDIKPSRSPDNAWIAYSSNRDGRWNIWVATTDGTTQRQVTFNEFAISSDPVWSPDGKYIVYETNKFGNWELVQFDLLTGQEVRLTENQATDVNPYWSPDSKKLLYQSLQDGFWQIYELDLETLGTTRISDGQGVDENPQYSGDGKQIVFQTLRDGRSNSVLALANADGSGVKLISDLNGNATNTSWSPDDKLIAYQMQIGDDIGIYVYEVATGLTRRVTDTQSINTSPTWFCGTTDLLFTSNAPGNRDIYTTNALPMTAPPIDVKAAGGQLTTHPASDQDPQNSPPEEDASNRFSNRPVR
jgi:TolB protein